MQSSSFFDRDLSWLSFNDRVLEEACHRAVPLLERIKFLSIYSSNLDEFYRVRMPAVMALQKIHHDADGKKESANKEVLQSIIQIINQQQERFGHIFSAEILPLLKEKGIHLLYNEPIPDIIKEEIADYFYTQVMAFLQPVYLSEKGGKFFPENNKLYLLTVIENKQQQEEKVIINIPSDYLSRFYTVQARNEQFVVFLDDIIKNNLPVIFKNSVVKGCYSIKITRDAELEVEDDYEGDLARKIEEQLSKRDFGLATRLLHEPGIPEEHLQSLITALKLQNALVIQGGCYHNLKDLGAFPAKDAALSYPKWPAASVNTGDVAQASLFEQIEQKDILLNPPYQSYNTVLRFFNEAAVDSDVTEIYVTLYRIASDSRIGNALVSAAQNGKKVSVLVELKARFDEANNIKWSKRMKAAGVKIIYSALSLKVHAKIALVKRIKDKRISYVGLLATGNMNESTARFYTDHILFTAHHEILREMELLFIFLGHRKKAGNPGLIAFNQLLVAQFNLQQRFLQLIDREINNARRGLEAAITIKMNNLEEKVLIKKLYEASNAGVTIRLIVRSICCLIPGVPGMSENITITRIVDRYLEHGRIFVFYNNGSKEVFMGSADWMNRNIYRRIEVCFPVYDAAIKQQLLDILQLQLNDNSQAVAIDAQLNNVPVKNNGELISSQQAIYQLLQNH